jgi:hypothetical protein
MSQEDTSGQWIEFYKKKGDNLMELSKNHISNKEYRKALELLKEAHTMYKKGNYVEGAKKAKAQFTEIKNTHFKKKKK